MTRVDRLAFLRALEEARRDPRLASYINRLVAEEGKTEAARTAAICLQERNLRTRPWQWVPAQVELGEVDAPGYEHQQCAAAAALLAQLRAAGLSNYEPDPVRALAEIEAAKSANRTVRNSDLPRPTSGARCNKTQRRGLSSMSYPVTDSARAIRRPA